MMDYFSISARIRSGTNPSRLEPKKFKPNPEATRVLLSSIERGNLAHVNTVLTMDFGFDTVDDEGMTPLMHAARRSDLKIVQALLKRGASPSLTRPAGRPSDEALQNNFPAVTECLTRAEYATAAAANAARQATPAEMAASATIA